jgi:hypothetical protein
MGKTFYGCCRYVCSNQQRATILFADGVRDYNYRLMAHDFEMNRQQLPNRHLAVFHGILSFHPSESLTDEKMTGIAQEYLQKLGVVDTQYIITKHTDKAHPHLHIIANLVNNIGVFIEDGWIGLNGKKVAQALTEKYQLVPAHKKELKLTNLGALNEEEGTRYEIYQAIEAALPSCNSLNDLEAFLIKRGIDTQYKYKGATQEIEGISFKKGLYAFKGSSIDRKYSIAGLQKIMQQQIERKQKQVNRRGLRLGR